jgi:hypothetical protein
MGVTYVTLGVLFWFWRFREASNFLLGSRKEELVDNTGANSDGANNEESLFGKLQYFLNRPDDVKKKFIYPKGFEIKKHLSKMTLINPETGNVFSGEATNPDFSRGKRYKAIFFDEFAFWSCDADAWGGAADTTNCRIVVTTPGRKPCKAKRLRFGTDGEKIKIITMHYTLDPRKDEAWLKKEKERRSDEDFAREVDLNWEASLSGRVYPEINQAIIGNYPLIQNASIYYTWDFGLDTTAVQVWQPNHQNGKWRLLDCYENKNQIIDFFMPLFGHPLVSLYRYDKKDIEAIDAFVNYPAGVHYGDPDVDKRSAATISTVRLTLQAHGIYIQTNAYAKQFAIRRDATKRFLAKGVEINDNPRTRHFIDCIVESQYPTRSDQLQVTRDITLPVHNWTSHQRSALEYLAVNLEAKGKISSTWANDDKPSRERVRERINQLSKNISQSGRTVNARMGGYSNRARSRSR